MSADELATFERLALQMAPSERQELLSKMPIMETIAGADKSLDETKVSAGYEIDFAFEEAIKSEPWYYRLVLWLRSLFTSISMEILYNNDRITSIYKRLNHEFPNMIDYKARVLLDGFYKNFLQLKEAAGYLRPFMEEVNVNVGAFYMTLGSFIVPEISEQIAKDADPYNLPLEREMTNELRVSLLRKIEEILKGITPEKRNQFYQCAASVEWLYQFTKLPFVHTEAEFQKSADAKKTASFENLAGDLDLFARILCNRKTIPPEVFLAIYLYAAKNVLSERVLALDEEGRENEFMHNVNSSIETMGAFVSAVPIKNINKIVTGNVRYQVGHFSGAEDWFVKYKDQWKRIFDGRWNNWVKEKRKDKMNTQLQKTLGIEKIPPLPYRPWANLWDGIPFHYENTAGFLCWFISMKFNESIYPLKTLLLEGQFENKENRQEFSDMLNELDLTARSANSFCIDISPTGQKGMLFEKFKNERVRTLPAQSKVDAIMIECETISQKLMNSFCDEVRSILKILGGVLGDKSDNRYDGVHNFSSIQGSNNATFRERLMESKEIFESVLNILKELEQIDLPARGKN